MITNQLGLFDFSSPRTSTLSPRTTVGSNGLSNSGLSSSIGVGPVGSSSGMASVSAATPSSLNGLFGIVNRPDLCYQNINTLQHYLKQSKNVVDTLTKAISTISDKDSPNYCCLLCKLKGKLGLSTKHSSLMHTN